MGIASAVCGVEDWRMDAGNEKGLDWIGGLEDWRIGGLHGRTT